MRATKRLSGLCLIARWGLSLMCFALAGFWLVAEAGEAGDSAIAREMKPLPEGFPMGVECTLTIARGQVQETLTGKIQKVTDDWIVLDDKAGSATMAGVPILNKIPYISRQFQNTGVQPRAREIWIPRSNLLYLSVDWVALGKETATAQAEPAGNSE